MPTVHLSFSKASEMFEHVEQFFNASSFYFIIYINSILHVLHVLYIWYIMYILYHFYTIDDGGWLYGICSACEDHAIECNLRKDKRGRKAHSIAYTACAHHLRTPLARSALLVRESRLIMPLFQRALPYLPTPTR